MGSSYISGIQKNLDDHMFQKLVAYKKAVYKDTYGTTTPLQRRIDPKLGKWVSYQRHACVQK